MSIQGSRQLVSTRNPTRYFLVPVGERWQRGDFAVRSLRGDEYSWTEEQLRPHEVSQEQAKAWFAAKIDQHLHRSKDIVVRYVDRFMHWLSSGERAGVDLGRRAAEFFQDLRETYFASGTSESEEERIEAAWDRAIEKTPREPGEGAAEPLPPPFLVRLLDALRQAGPREESASKIRTLADRVESAGRHGAERLRGLADDLFPIEPPDKDEPPPALSCPPEPPSVKPCREDRPVAPPEVVELSMPPEPSLLLEPGQGCDLPPAAPLTRPATRSVSLPPRVVVASTPDAPVRGDPTVVVASPPAQSVVAVSGSTLPQARPGPPPVQVAPSLAFRPPPTQSASAPRVVPSRPCLPAAPPRDPATEVTRTKRQKRKIRIVRKVKVGPDAPELGAPQPVERPRTLIRPWILFVLLLLPILATLLLLGLTR